MSEIMAVRALLRRERSALKKLRHLPVALSAEKIGMQAGTGEAAARIAIMPCAHVRVDAEYVVAALVLAGSADPGHESGCDRHLRVQARTAMCGAWSGVSAVRSERPRRAWMAC